MRLIGNVEKDAQVRAVASGALPSGDAVIVNADGTVSVVDATSGPAGFGSSVVFNAANSRPTATAFDSNSNKVVIAYRDYGNSSYGTAIVGTVSGSSISFGTPVVFESDTTDYPSIAFDSNSNKIVIAYKDEGNSNYGTSIVGTVSGSSISFGSPAVFQSDNFFYADIIFDSSNNRVVINYAPAPNYYLYAIVGSVSGTSISFGSAVQVATNNSDQARSTFDSSSNKVVLTYKGGSNYGTAIVGTVSGTSISFGSPAVFDSESIDNLSTTFDSNSNKVVTSYRRTSSSNKGTSVVGTVSGSSISFGTPVDFFATSGGATDMSSAFNTSTNKVMLSYREGQTGGLELVSGTVSGTSISFSSPITFVDGAVSSPTMSSAFDSTGNNFIIAYVDSLNSTYGTAIVYAPNSTNLTAENFLGFADSGYADGQSAAINSTCTVDRNQTSLTAGQTYYVQTDGSLGTTAADPSVVAGTAISSTEIIVKG